MGGIREIHKHFVEFLPMTLTFLIGIFPFEKLWLVLNLLGK